MEKYISPLPKEKLKPIQFLLDIVYKKMGFVPGSLKTMAHIPAIVTSYSSLFANVFSQYGEVPPLTGLKLGVKNIQFTLNNLKRKDRLPMELKHMVAYISSRTAGCLYCQAHTIGQAAKSGVPGNKLEEVWNFERSQLFTASEKAALRFGVAASATPNAVIPDHFIELKKYYSETQIVELGSVIALFGFLNRWNDTFSTPLEEEAIVDAEKYLTQSGWTVGKHR